MKRTSSFLVLGAVAVLSGCSTNSQTPDAQSNGSPAPVSQSSTTGAPTAPVQGYIRALHAVPGAGTLSLSADGQKFATATYGNASSFTAFTDSKIEVSAFGGDGKKVAGPVPIRLSNKGDVTLLITGVPGDTVLLPWKHKDDGPEKDRAKIAFVHSAKALPSVDIDIDGKSFRRGVKFGIATDPTILSPGRHRVTVTYDKSLAPTEIEVQGGPVITQDEMGNTVAITQPTPIRTLVPRHQMVVLTQEVDLMAGKVYSLAIFHDGAHQPKVRLMEDQFAGEKNQP